MKSEIGVVRSTGWVKVLLISMLCGMALLLPNAAKRAWAADFTISGNVYDNTHQPLENIEITAGRLVHDPEMITPRFESVVTTTSDSNGAYTLTVSDQGPFKIRFSDSVVPARYQTEYYIGHWSPFTANDVIPSDGSKGGTLKDVALTPTFDFIIQGKVVDEAGNPVEQIEVTANQMSGNPALELPYWAPVTHSTTDANGFYTVTVPNVGPYRIGFRDAIFPPRYHTEFYDNVTLARQANDLLFDTQTVISDINAQLSAASVITGQVSDERDQPVNRVQVLIYQPIDDGSGQVSWQIVNEGVVDSNGQYTMTLAYSGTVRVGFFDQVWPSRFASDFFNKAQSIETATDVAVTIGSVTPQIDGHVAMFGAVLGRVTDKNSNPIKDVTVGGYQVVTDEVGTTTWATMTPLVQTDANGVYTLPVPSAVTTHVCFNMQLNLTHFAPRCYGSNLADPAIATDISIQPGERTEGINIQLGAFPRVYGTVTDKVDNPLQGATMILHLAVRNPDGNIGFAGFLQSFTDSQGNYEIWNASEFRLGIMSANYSDGFEAVEEWYEHATDYQSAIPITMELDSEIPVNFQLAIGGTISGHVSNELTGEALSGIPIILYHFVGDAQSGSWSEVKRRNTDGNGNYSLNFLPPDSYRLGFDGGVDYRQEFYSDTLTLDSALDLVITESLKIGNIDAQLTPTPRLIGGHVASQDGTSISNITVNLFQPSGNNDGVWVPSLLSTSTNEQGNYQLSALPPNLYKVQFVDSSQAYYATEFYSNVRTIEAADVITIAPGNVITNVDAQLEVGEAEVTISIDVIPDSRQNFRFSSTLGDFRMDDSGTDDGDSYTNMVTFLVAKGTYTFTLHLPVDYYINSWSCSKDGLGWNGYEDGNISVQVSSGERAQCDYRLQRTVDVEALSYHDANGNGMQDEGEPLLAGWPIVLYTGEPLSETATNANGLAAFTHVRPISYLVCERVPAGWSNTQPGTVIESIGMPCLYAELIPGQKAAVRFGNIESNDPDFNGQPSTATDSVRIDSLPDITNDDDGYGDQASTQLFLPLLCR
ncbi:MAG: carboxypeptidase regulatory-like domain-containing protein [Caldilineaceae bacterium]